MSSTKVLFALAKLWKLGTLVLLPPNMLTIILSRSQTSIVFFLNNSRLIYNSFSFLYGFVFLIFFYFLFCLSIHIFDHFAFHFYPWKAVDRQPKAPWFSFLNFLSSEHFSCDFIMSYPGCTFILNSVTEFINVIEDYKQ